MEYIDAVYLGVVQGLTEFLPVSSSGHLVILQKFLGFDQHSVPLDVAVHFGTLLSVLTIYRKEIFKIANDFVSFPKNKLVTPSLRVLALVCIGTIPTAVLGLTFKDIFLKLFSNISAVGVCLCLTGIILFLTRNRGGSETSVEIELNEFTGFQQLTVGKALIIGFVQGLAIAPGISRSGSTIAAGLAMGLDRRVAAAFSFLLAIPAILGASILQMREIGSQDGSFYGILFVAVVVAYFVGLLGLKTVLYFVKKGRLELFSVYLWILGTWLIFSGQL